MYLQKLSLTNFKNYSTAELSFSEKINCFAGKNGVGKTNLLDAVYYLSFCKSYFNSQDSQNIKHEEEFFAVHGVYKKNGDQDHLVSCIQRRNQKKQFKLNKKDYERLADHIGLFPLVMVSPADSDLISLGSEERRKYIDGVISQFDRFYLDDLLNYNKALLQRNTLLRHYAETGTFNEESLNLWTAQLVDLGSKIYTRRNLFLDDFLPMFQFYFEVISGGREKVRIEYQSHLNEDDVEMKIKQALSRDLALRYSTIGIHKDDLVFYISDFPAKKFGSQGQQKSFLVALKLAQFEYTRNKKGFKPILLFDDIFDKLDENRVAHLVKLVSDDSFGQVFITDTHQERLEAIFKKSEISHKIFVVEEGKLTENR